MSLPASRSIAEDADLFLVLLIVVNGVIAASRFPEPGWSPGLLGTFYLALFVHVALTLYVGSFGRLRTATWLLLIAAWAGSEIAAFAGYVLPWNQLSIVRDLRAAAAVWWPPAALLILALDVVVMQTARWRTRSAVQIAVFLVAAVAALQASARPGHASAFAVVPEWYALPLFALLRAVPVKALGVAVMFAALLVPMVWPWMRAERLRIGRTRWAWRALCLMLAATWIGLGYLGAQPPEGAALAAARVLAIVYFAGFLVLTPALHRLAGGPR